MKPVTIFYEDRRGPQNEFGFHNLICALVIKRAGIERTVYDVRKNLIHGIPLKGNANIRNRCRRDLRRLADCDQHVIAVYDEDKAARLAGLPGGSCRRPVCDSLVRDCEPLESLDVILLRDNIETVLGEIRDSGLTGIDDAAFDRAVRGNKHLDRDIIFNKCAHDPAVNRQRLLELMPSVEHLVNKVLLRLNR
jgi:hypothetical protein